MKYYLFGYLIKIQILILIFLINFSEAASKDNFPEIQEPEPTTTTSSPSRFLKTNPDISVNILLLGKKTFQKMDEKEHKDSHEHTNSSSDHSDHSEQRQNGFESENHTEPHKHELKDGVFLQELEFYFKSNIDPYWSGNVSLGLTQTGSSIEFNLEEAFIESLFIPNLTLKAGKFYALIGRHNSLHTHNYPFIDPSLVNEILFGAHGFGGTGASLSYLAPFFPWYFEVTIQAFYKPKFRPDIIKDTHKPGSTFTGDIKNLAKSNMIDPFSENLFPEDPTTDSFSQNLFSEGIFDSSHQTETFPPPPEDEPLISVDYIPFAGVLFLKNLWDLNDSSTLELTFAYGREIERFKHLYNLSSTYKYQPLDSSKKHSLNWTTEFFKSTGPDDRILKYPIGFMGLSSYLQWQFSQNWWIQGRTSAIMPTWKEGVKNHKHSLLLAFAATEYSAVRLQYDASKTEHENWEHSVALQLNMSLGTHPAHLY